MNNIVDYENNDKKIIILCNIGSIVIKSIDHKENE